MMIAIALSPVVIAFVVGWVNSWGKAPLYTDLYQLMS